MSLQRRLHPPRFHRWLTLVLALGLAGCLALAVAGGWLAEPDLGPLATHVDRMMLLYDAQPEMSRRERVLAGVRDRAEIERGVLSAYENADPDLDAAALLERALVLWHFGKLDAAREMTARAGDPDFHSFRAAMAALIDGRPMPDDAEMTASMQLGDWPPSWWAVTFSEAVAAQGGIEIEELEEAVAQNRAERREIARRAVLLGAANYALLAAGLCLAALWRRGRSDPRRFGYPRAVGAWGLRTFASASLRPMALGVLLVLGAMFGALVLGATEGVGANLGIMASQVMTTVLFAWYFLPGWRLAKRAFRLGLEQLRRARTWGLVGLGILAGGLADEVIVRLATPLGLLDVSDFVDLELIQGGWQNLALYLVMACVLAPISEEVVFRGLFYPTLRRRLGIGWALVLSSAIFAAIHFYSGIGTVAIFIHGMIFALLYERSGSLWPGIIVHALGNILPIAGVWIFYRPV